MGRRVSVVLLSLVLLRPAALRADDDARWQDQTVVALKSGVKLRHADEQRREQIALQGLTTGKITRVQGDLVWVATDGGAAGWVRKADVLPLEEALAHFTKRLRDKPDDTEAWFRRALAWVAKKEYDHAIDDYTELIRLVPDFAGAFNNRASVYEKKGDFIRAGADLSEAVRLKPGNALYYCNRGNNLVDREYYDIAVAEFTEALRLDPTFAAARAYRSNAFALRREYDRAVADITEALRMEPADALVLNCAAWLRATCLKDGVRDGATAVALARKACEQSAWKDAICLDTLAAAYAEAGDFVQAVTWEQKAIALAQPGKMTAYRARLKLYEQKKPYRN